MALVARGDKVDDVNTKHPICIAPGTIGTDICSTDVFIHGIGTHREGDLNEPHTHCPPVYGTPVTSYSPDVYANDKKVARLGDDYSCSAFIEAVTQPNVYANNKGSGGGGLIDNTATVPTPERFPGQVVPEEYKHVSQADEWIEEYADVPLEDGGYIDEDENNSSPIQPPAYIRPARPPGMESRPMEAAEEDNTVPPSESPPAQDCSDVGALDNNFTWAETGSDFRSWATSFALSTNFTVADMCYGAVKTHKFSSSVVQASGKTQKEILFNMCHHAKTVLEPLRAKYGRFLITSGYRNGSGRSQHEKGQATDIQFMDLHSKSNTGVLYYERAKETRDIINYDQFILEWYARNPWFHLSSNPVSHRKKVNTQVAEYKYDPGLKLLRHN